MHPRLPNLIDLTHLLPKALINFCAINLFFETKDDVLIKYLSYPAIAKTC